MHDPNSIEGRIAKVIWETSRADEGTISALGADNVASALVAAGFGQEAPQEPRLVVDGVEQDPADPESWRIGPGQIVALPPDPLERIAEALESIGPTITNAVSEALVWNDSRRR